MLGDFITLAIPFKGMDFRCNHFGKLRTHFQVKEMKNGFKGFVAITFLALAILLVPQTSLAHCDTLDGPVVVEARDALTKGDVYPLLKWVKAEEEKEISEAFIKIMAVRKLSPAAQKLADMYFFETLVRIHRAGEGAPYTGIKATETGETVVAKADQALGKGSIDGLSKAIAAHTEKGIRERFNHALETRKDSQESLQAGREYVKAYVTYTHYVEGSPRLSVAKAMAPRRHPRQPTTNTNQNGSGTLAKVPDP